MEQTKIQKKKIVLKKVLLKYACAAVAYSYKRRNGRDTRLL